MFFCKVNADRAFLVARTRIYIVDQLSTPPSAKKADFFFAISPLFRNFAAHNYIATNKTSHTI